MTTPTFAAFFEEIHGYAPFPWQEALAEQVQSQWIDVNAPTGAGKTSTIDVWLYDLGRRVLEEEPIAYRRLVYVVDRRIVVDGTFQHAVSLAQKLHDAEDGPLKQIADALRSLAREPVPVLVSRMRGGTWRDETWASNPAQPVILVSTVDQAGSRLLGRGYGCSRSLQVVSAGLLGNDALWLFDEAHLSQAAVETIHRVSEYHAHSQERTANPPQLVELTATPRDPTCCIELGPSDLVHPVLGKRLTASKIAKLEKVNVGSGPTVVREKTFAKSVVKRCLPLARGAKVVGVVCNRVGTAREVFDQLSKAGKEAILLTGRTRPHDRDLLLAEYLPFIRAGRSEDPGEPLFVVATQCIEVGADLDFDALVTEAAPLDALRQRFGRLNRLGRKQESHAVILCRSDVLGAKGRDPIYGPATDRTWKWLTTDRRKEIDFGLSALELPPADELTGMLNPRPLSRQLLKDDLEDLAASNLPSAIDLSLYLHGVQSSADAYLVWRDDIGDELSPDRLQEVVATVTARSPRALEQLPVPAWQVQQWLKGKAAELADIEGTPVQPFDGPSEGRGLVLRFVAEDPEQSEMIEAVDAKPGDVLVVPSDYGGCDKFGWNPSSQVPVEDIGDACAWRCRGRPIVHIRFADVGTVSGAKMPPTGVLDGYLAQHEAHQELTDRGRKIRRYSAGWMVTGTPLIFPGETITPVVPQEERVEGSDVSLSVHSAGVAEWAKRFAELVVPDFADSLCRAGQLHDLGKADSRWQYAIAGGEFRDDLLAKSDQTPESFARYLSAREQCGLPVGWRHETLSVQLAESLESDPLVLHLIAAHHGWGHPWPGIVHDGCAPGVDAFQIGGDVIPGLPGARRIEDEMVALAGRCASRYEETQTAFGLWQRCLLEAVLILADWRQSSRERLGLVDPDASTPVMQESR